MPLDKLNLGAGNRQLDGWLNVDITDGVDLTVFPWSFESNSASHILASHILEHLDKRTAYLFLAECARVLAPSGKLYLAVPDMDIFINCRLSGDWTPLRGYKWTDFNWFFGGDNTEGRHEQRHRYMYNEETLIVMMMGAGFFPQRREFTHGLDTNEYEPISLYMLGEKVDQCYLSRAATKLTSTG
jgi:predicted SAM-dependent methyltransferase